MSIRVTSWVFDHAPVKGTDLVLLLVIGDRANEDGTDAWPAISTIAKRSRVPRRTAQRRLRRLEEVGELVTLVGIGPRGQNIYIVRMGRTNDELSPIVARIVKRWGTPKLLPPLPVRSNGGGGDILTRGGGTSDARYILNVH